MRAVKTRHNDGKSFEQVELEDAENIDELHMNGWPRNCKNYRERGVDLQVRYQDLQLTRGNDLRGEVRCATSRAI